MHQVSTLSCCTIIPANVSGTRLGYSCSITSVDAAARSASAAHSALPASAIAAANLERRTIREIAMLADLAKSAVATRSSARTTSTSVFGRLSNFYYLKKVVKTAGPHITIQKVLKRKTTVKCKSSARASANICQWHASISKFIPHKQRATLGYRMAQCFMA